MSTFCAVVFAFPETHAQCSNASEDPNGAILFCWGPRQLVFLDLKPPPPQRYPLPEELVLEP
jgi:hypothetical protein